MKTFISVVILIIVLTTNVWAVVHTDTHTYIVCTKSNSVLAINRKTGQFIEISVGEYPQSLVIHGDRGYVMNSRSHNVSIIDIKRNGIVCTICVGAGPHSMVIYEDRGYVINEHSGNVSVLDLNSPSVIQTISVGFAPQPMKIYSNRGYVANSNSGTLSVLDLKTNTVIQTIPVGSSPSGMVIHGDRGYVANTDSDTISVIDLDSPSVIRTIPVGRSPRGMVIHGDKGYVANWVSGNISVLDLNSNTVIQIIPVGERPCSLEILGGTGYVKNYGSRNVSVIDLQMNRVIKTFDNPDDAPIYFSYTHVYLGHKKYSPHFPILSRIYFVKRDRILDDFVKMMPEVFELGEIEKRKFPKEKNEFDMLPVYLLAQNIFWDVNADKPLMDPKDILATLVTMKYPQKFLKGDLGIWLRNRLHTVFFQTVWVGDKDKVKAMLTYFVQLQDPVITKLATYTFKGAKESSDQKAKNSMWVINPEVEAPSILCYTLFVSASDINKILNQAQSYIY